MVTFNELSFSDDVQSLYIDCNVESGEHIEKVYLEYYKNRNTTGAPSPKALLVWPGPSAEEVSVEVDASQLSISDNGVDSFIGGVFYVLVHWKDSEDEDHYDIGLVLDWSHVYKIGMDSIAGFVNGCSKKNCDIPEYFEQTVIAIHALQLAIESKDMDMIDTLWSRFISFSPMSNVQSCNCR